VTLISIFRESERDHNEDIRPYCESLYPVGWQDLVQHSLLRTPVVQQNGRAGRLRDTATEWKSYWRTALQTFPREIIASLSPPILHTLYEVVRGSRFDVAFIAFPEAAAYGMRLPSNLLRVFDAHEARSIRILRLLRAKKNPLKKAYLFLEWVKWRRIESKLGSVYDLIIAITPLEQRYFYQLNPRANVLWIPRGVDVDYFYPVDHAIREENSLLYVGYFGNIANVDAIMFFVEKVWPKVKVEIPGVRLSIVGSYPPPKIIALGEKEDIRVTGFVEDIRPFLSRASILVAPIRQGAGVKVKILQAMAMATPVVSTVEGIEGIEGVVDGEHALIARNADEFAQKAIMLLRNPVLRANLGQNARSLMFHIYNWQENMKELEEAILERLARKRIAENRFS